MGNTYRVKVLSSNSTIIFRDKVLRTPVVCKNVYEKELDLLKLQIKRNALKAEIVDESTEEFIDTSVNVIVSEKKYIQKSQKVQEDISEDEIEIEEFYDPSFGENSIIDRLIEKDKGE